MKKYAILTGGTSEEREIALKSADTFRTHLTHPCDVYVFPEERDDFLQNLSLYDTVIPVFHGAYGEDGKLSAFLEVLDMKVCLSPFATHAL